MKKLLLFIALSLLANHAQAADATRISVVDMQKLLDSSTAASGIKEQAKKERDEYQALIAKEEESLRQEEAKLAEQRTLLTPEAFNEKRRQFNDKLTKVQRDFQEKRALHEEKLRKSLDQVNKVIFEIIDSLAETDGFDITIPTSQILYAAKKLDITETVLEKLNAKLPKLEPAKDENASSDDKNKKVKNKKKGAESR